MHLVGALFNARTGADMVHVPYKGAGPALTALIAGEIQVMFVTTTLGLPHIRAGRIKVLAYNHPRRASFMPEVPTMIEAGVMGTEMDASWHGLFAPARHAARRARAARERAAQSAGPARRERSVHEAGSQRRWQHGGGVPGCS